MTLNNITQLKILHNVNDINVLVDQIKLIFDKDSVHVYHKYITDKVICFFIDGLFDAKVWLDLSIEYHFTLIVKYCSKIYINSKFIALVTGETIPNIDFINIEPDYLSNEIIYENKYPFYIIETGLKNISILHDEAIRNENLDMIVYNV